ncbi:MAG: fimbria/pilus outer membrane usher protein [Candidatus Velthaea sp.]
MRGYLAAIYICLGLIAATSVASVGAPALTDVVYAVRLNGIDVSSGALLLRSADGTLYASDDDLLEWRLGALTDTGKMLVHEGRRYHALRGVPHLRALFDDLQQQLDLTADAQLLATRVHASLVRPIESVDPSRTVGAFLNYDIQSTFAQQTRPFVTALLDGAASLGNGTLQMSATAQTGSAFVRGVHRLNSVWQRDFPARAQTIRVGDTVTTVGPDRIETRFGGVQWTTNFATQPGSVFAPLPSVAGSADVPSALDVYVNDVLTTQMRLPEGPFVIDDLPAIDGQGRVRLVITDAAGHRRVIAASYYSEATLLRPGIGASSIQAGFERLGFAAQTDHYGQFIATATHRRGISERLTVEAALGFDAFARDANAGADWLIPRIGVLHGAREYAAGGGRSGQESAIAFQSSGTRTKVRFSAQFASPHLPTIGTPIDTRAQRALQANISTSISPRSALTLAYSAQDRPAFGLHTRLLAGTLTTTIAGHQVFANAIKALNPGGALFVFISLPIETKNGRSVVATTDIQNSKATQALHIAQNAASTSAGSSYSADVSSNKLDRFRAHIDRYTPVGIASAQLFDLGNRIGGSLEIRGALSFVGGRTFASQPITQSFGVVDIGDFPGIHVDVNGVPAGKTDARGQLFIHDLAAYRPNLVRLDTRDLPLAANPQSSQLVVVPYYRSAVHAQFPRVNSGGFVIRILRANGLPLPSGSTLSGIDGAATWPVGEDGKAYIDAVPSGNLVVVASADGTTCRFTVNVPPHAEDVPDLGTAVCR